MPWKSILFIACLLLAVFGLRYANRPKSLSRLPAQPDRLILYSIDGPAHFSTDGELTPTLKKGELLHGYPVLGKVEITNSDQKREIIDTIKESIRNNSETPATCFIPRHAIRVMTADDVLDVVLCFQCHAYELYAGTERAPVETRGLSSAAQELLNQILTDADVQLASKECRVQVR